MSNAISARIQNSIFQEAERIRVLAGLPRNAYINKALELANKYYKTTMIQKKLQQESLATQNDSMTICSEFDTLMN